MQYCCIRAPRYIYVAYSHGSNWWGWRFCNEQSNGVKCVLTSDWSRIFIPALPLLCSYKSWTFFGPLQWVIVHRKYPTCFSYLSGSDSEIQDVCLVECSCDVGAVVMVWLRRYYNNQHQHQLVKSCGHKHRCRYNNNVVAVTFNDEKPGS